MTTQMSYPQSVEDWRDKKRYLWLLGLIAPNPTDPPAPAIVRLVSLCATVTDVL